MTPNDRRRHRLGDLIMAWAWRPLVFAFWAGVFWGTLLDLALLWVAVTQGPGTALRLLTRPSAAPLAAALNLGLALLAVVVWAGILALNGRGRSPAPGAPPAD
jgi:hypothetical protein